MVGQGDQEARHRVPGHNPSFSARVFRHEPDFVTVDMPEPVLCDGGTAGTAARVAEELPLTLEPLDMDIPPAFVLVRGTDSGPLQGFVVAMTADTATVYTESLYAATTDVRNAASLSGRFTSIWTMRRSCSSRGARISA